MFTFDDQICRWFNQCICSNKNFMNFLKILRWYVNNTHNTCISKEDTWFTNTYKDILSRVIWIAYYFILITCKGQVWENKSNTKTFRTNAIANIVIPHKTCATSYDTIFYSVKCKQFKNVIKHIFNFKNLAIFWWLCLQYIILDYV